jgi:toxin FitB
MVILDTNVISELMKKAVNPRVASWLDQIPVHQVYTSAISKAEIQYGVSILPAGKKKAQIEEMVTAVLNLFSSRVLPFTSETATLFAGIKSERKKIGRPISYADAQIAAIACLSGFRLATRNTVDFEEIDGLLLINPWEEKNRLHDIVAQKSFFLWHESCSKYP